MTLVDSSCWIAFFLDHPKGAAVEKYLQDGDHLIVPTIVIYEVHRQLARKIGNHKALFFVTQMEEGLVIPLDEETAIYAAQMSLKHNLGTADAVIYATALMHEANVVTLDNNFRKLPDCLVLET